MRVAAYGLARAARRRGDRDAGHLPVTEVVLYTAAGCHLCAAARRVVDRCARRARVRAAGGRDRRRPGARGRVPRVDPGRRDRRPRARFVYHVHPDALRRAVAQASGSSRLVQRRTAVTKSKEGGRVAERLNVGVAARLSRYLQVLTQARKMGKTSDLVAGDRGVHEHQRDADPPRPVDVRQVRQARRRLLDRARCSTRSARSCARRASTTSRSSAPAGSARRSPRPRSSRSTASTSPPSSTPTRRSSASPIGHVVVEPYERLAAARARPQRRRRRARRAGGRRPAGGGRSRLCRREDRLQLLRGAARDSGRRDGVHVESRGRAAVRAVFPSDLRLSSLARVLARRHRVERLHPGARARVEPGRARRHRRLPGAAPGALRPRRRARRRAGAAGRPAARLRPRPLRGPRGAAARGLHGGGAGRVRRGERRGAPRARPGGSRVREPRPARRARRRRERHALPRQGARLGARVRDARPSRPRALGCRDAGRRGGRLRRLRAHPGGARGGRRRRRARRDRAAGRRRGRVPA